MIHICHISQSAGGVETYIGNIIRSTRKEQFRHTVICYTNGTLSETARELGAEVVLVPMFREISFLQDLVSLGKVLSAVRDLKPDVIHAHSGKGGIFGRLTGLFLGVPVIFTPNAFSYLKYQGVKRYPILTIEKVLSYAPCLLVAATESEARRAITEVGWRPEKVTRIFPNSIEMGSRRVNHRNKKGINVLMLGRLCYQKNPEMFLRIADLVRSYRPNITFTILGAGYGDELIDFLMTFIKDRGLEQTVVIKPWSDLVSYKNYLLSCDIYVSTSRYEGLAITLLDAMEAGMPVVSTMVDGAMDIIRDGENGYLVEVDNDEQMANYIIKLADDYILRARIGQSARETIVGFYNIRKNICNLEQLYLALTAADHEKGNNLLGKFIGA